MPVVLLGQVDIFVLMVMSFLGVLSVAITVVFVVHVQIIFIITPKVAYVYAPVL